MQTPIIGLSREIEQYKDQMKMGVFLFTAITILCLSISGLIMNASGVPWTSEENIKWEEESNEYISTYDSKDWENCCEDLHKEIDSSDEEQQTRYDTLSIIFSPMTSLFILAICFSSSILLLIFLPVPRLVKEIGFTLFGLSIMTTGVFFVRKFSLWVSYYFTEIFNLNSDQDPSFHLHFMIYYGGFIGLICIITGFIVQNKIGTYIRTKKLNYNTSRQLLNLLLITSLSVFLLSPLLPIAHIEYDQKYDSYSEETMPNGYFLFPIELLVADDEYSAVMEFGNIVPNNDDALEVFVNYDLVENFYLSIFWISIGCLGLISLALIPKIGFIFESISQVMILTIGIIIPIIIFTIFLYIGVVDLDSDTGLYTSDMYSDANFNSNWIMPVCGMISLVTWIMILVKSHIPWWNSMLDRSEIKLENNIHDKTAVFRTMNEQPIQETIKNN